MNHHLFSSSRWFCAVLLPVLIASGISFSKPDLSKLRFHAVPLTQAIGQQSSPTADQSPNANAADLPPVSDIALPSATSIKQYEQALAAAEKEEGPFGMAVSELSLALGQQLLMHGELTPALAAFERSRQVLRVNLGLYNLDQVPVMASIINVYLQQQDVGNAHDMQQALFNLQLKAHGRDQLSAIPAFIEWADWNVNLYLLQDPRLPELIDGKLPQLHQHQLGDQRLGIAYSSYKAAIDILQNQSSLGDERLITTERKLAALNFMINRKLQDTYGGGTADAGNHEADPPGQAFEQANAAYFMDGGSALRRVVAYSYSSPETEYDDIAARLMELGDWYLLFDHRADALNIYQDALEVMEAASLPREEVERIMSPGMPVKMPDETYLASRAGYGEFAGYIDVQFDLSRFGHAIKPQIIGSSANDRKIEKELLRTIRSCKFRPKFIEGSAVNQEKMQLRYYYSL